MLVYWYEINLLQINRRGYNVQLYLCLYSYTSLTPYLFLSFFIILLTIVSMALQCVLCTFPATFSPFWNQQNFSPFGSGKLKRNLPTLISITQPTTLTNQTFQAEFNSSSCRKEFFNKFVENFCSPTISTRQTIGPTWRPKAVKRITCGLGVSNFHPSNLLILRSDSSILVGISTLIFASLTKSTSASSKVSISVTAAANFSFFCSAADRAGAVNSQQRRPRRKRDFVSFWVSPPLPHSPA